MVLPGIIKRIIHFLFVERSGFAGNYANWSEAISKSRSYRDPLILQKVLNAALKVKNGEAVYERDSVVFDHLEYSWPLLSALLWVALKKSGHLSVIDFGGSLGTTYFQNKRFLDELENVSWNIVEQEDFVETGNKFLKDNRLGFFGSIGACISSKGIPDIIILSCSLPYIADPYQLLASVLNYPIQYLLIDNTPFNYQPEDRITLQTVPSGIYKATYPAWFLDYSKVKELLVDQYDVIFEHQNESALILDRVKVRYKGLFMERKKEIKMV